MYARFFGLRERPFDLRPDPSFLYLAERHAMALTMLEYGLSGQDGFVVITGEVGSGKTTLLRHVLGRLDESTEVGLVSCTHESFENLMPWVLLAFGLDYKGKSAPELYDTFTTFAIEQFAAGRRVVLLVDEAQNLSARTLEELRLLSNLNADRSQVVHVALIGQPELRTTLARHDLRQFRQRISVAFHLEPLTRAETGGYIAHRLEVAGGTGSLFTPDAVDEVFAASGGIPRLVNLICDTALVYAYAEQQRAVDAGTVAQVVQDRRDTQLLPLADREAAGPPPAAASIAAPP